MDHTKQTQGAKGSFRKNCIWGTQLAPSVEHMTLGLRVVSSSPNWSLLKKKKKLYLTFAEKMLLLCNEARIPRTITNTEQLGNKGLLEIKNMSKSSRTIWEGTVGRHLPASRHTEDKEAETLTLEGAQSNS